MKILQSAFYSRYTLFHKPRSVGREMFILKYDVTYRRSNLSKVVYQDHGTDLWVSVYGHL